MKRLVFAVDKVSTVVMRLMQIESSLTSLNPKLNGLKPSSLKAVVFVELKGKFTLVRF